MSNGRRVGCIVAVIVGVLIGLTAIGGTAAYMLLGRDGSASYAPPFRPKLSFGDGSAIVERQGFPDTSTPFALRGVKAAQIDRAVWEWTHQGQGLGSWTRDGSLAAGELVANDNITTAFVFDRDRGFLFEIDGIQGYSSRLVGDGELLVRRGGELSLYRVASGATPAWSAPLPAGAYVAFYAVTANHVIAFNDGVGMHVYSRASGGTPVVVQGVEALAGVDRDREEAIVLRGGRVEVLGLADGASRATLALADAAIVDSGDIPCVLGTFQGARLIVYSTALDVSHSGPPNYQELAERTIAAVDDAGAVAWRTSIGPWNVRCTPLFTNLLATDRDRGAHVVLTGDRTDPNGSSNLLASLGAGGSIEWRAEVPGEPLSVDGRWLSFARDGTVYVARLGETSIERAIRVPSFAQVAATSEDEIWITRGDESARFGPDLAPGPLGSTEALAEVRGMLGLPTP
jgi:hypothetical protein